MVGYEIKTCPVSMVTQLQLSYQGTPVDAAEEILLQPAYEALSER